MARASQHRIRTLSRSESNSSKLRQFADDVVTRDATVPGSLGSICEGVQTVVSCLGAAVVPDAPERRSFRQVDTPANLRVIECARSAGVKRFLYVSLHLEPAYAETAYVRAHEEVVAAIQSSGMTSTIVRPTGVFRALGSFLDLARKGVVPSFGSGQARTNPIHELDAARVLLKYLDQGPGEISVGGPDVLTRRQIANLAFQALGKGPRVLAMPPGFGRFIGKLMRVWSPRIAEMTEFGVAVTNADCVAPKYGTLRLADYFAALARQR